MSKPFDATLKDLASIDPGGLLGGIDAPPTVPVRLLNVDLSTVTAATDIVFGLGEPLQEVIHLDAQAGPDPEKHRDLLAYSALLHRQYRVPVHSILLLLRHEALLKSQTGSIHYEPRPGRGKMDFGYEVLRLWERPVEALLSSGLGALPLAPLCRLPEGLSLEEGMRWVVTRVLERLDEAGEPALVQRLFKAAFVLSTLRLDREQLRSLVKGLRIMGEHNIFEELVDEFRAEGVQRVLLHLGRKKCGEPDEATRLALAGITDLDRLDRLSERVLEVASWQELLQTP